MLKPQPQAAARLNPAAVPPEEQRRKATASFGHVLPQLSGLGAWRFVSFVLDLARRPVAKQEPQGHDMSAAARLLQTTW